MNSGVKRILVRDGCAVGVELDTGEEILAERVFSSAGFAETMRLVEPETPPVDGLRRLSFFESIAVLDAQPAALAHDATVSFFNRSERFAYRDPDGAVDVQSGVVCTPNNFARSTPLEEGYLRITALANYAHWSSLQEESYRAQKISCADAMLDSAACLMPELASVREHTVFRDTFTPRTIEHYTGHLGGAVYGSPLKHRDGATPIARLSVIGTDQGMLGIVGAMLSGITIANRHALAELRT
jgi:phytoene dehydrogenase-like protein